LGKIQAIKEYCDNKIAKKVKEDLKNAKTKAKKFIINDLNMAKK
jgi:hypothetical protein